MERQYVAIDLHLRRSLIVRENEAGEELNREHETRVDVLFKGVGAMQLPSVMAALTAMRCRFPVRSRRPPSCRGPGPERSGRP